MAWCHHVSHAWCNIQHIANGSRARTGDGNHLSVCSSEGISRRGDPTDSRQIDGRDGSSRRTTTEFFEPAQLAEQVRKLGFAEVSAFGPREAEARYFTGRTDGLRPLAYSHFTRARVGPNLTDPA